MLFHVRGFKHISVFWINLYICGGLFENQGITGRPTHVMLLFLKLKDFHSGTES